MSLIEIICTRPEGNIPAYLSIVTEKEYSDLANRLTEFMQPNELNYFQKLKIEKRRKDFVLANYAAKQITAKFLEETDFSKIEIFSGILEQPLVKYPAADIPEVSLSHSHGVAVAIACPAGHPVGIDIEKLDAGRKKVFQRQLTEQEIDLIKKSGLDEALIYNQLWTVKEALSKVLKCGLTVPFKLLEIAKPQFSAESLTTCLFKNFRQYRCYAYIINEYALSIVLPRKTELFLDTASLQNLSN